MQTMTTTAAVVSDSMMRDARKAARKMTVEQLKFVHDDACKAIASVASTGNEPKVKWLAEAFATREELAKRAQ